MTTMLQQEGAPDPELLPDPIEALTGVDGNAFSIIATVSRYLRDANASREYVQSYRDLAMSGDYDHLIAVSIAVLDGENQ